MFRHAEFSSLLTDRFPSSASKTETQNQNNLGITMIKRALARVIVRHLSYGTNTVRNLRYLGLGFLLVFSFTVFSYMRAGEDARVYASTGNTVNFQARLYTSGGGKVQDGNYSIAFSTYTTATGGTAEWTETHPSVIVKNGYFSVKLGDVNSFPASTNWSVDRWLTMNVNGDGEMTPRIQFTSVPYAFQAEQASSLKNGSGSLTADQLVQLAPSSPQVVNSALAALRINQTGNGLLAQLQGDSSDVFTVAKTGDLSSSGNGTFSGGSLTLGSAAQSGGLTMFDNSGNTLSILPGSQSGNLAFTFPGSYGSSGDCLQTNGSGTLSFGACGSGGGSSTTLAQAYENDVDGGNAVISLTAADDSLILRNPSSGGTDSGYAFSIEQLASGAVDGLRINNSGSGALAVFDATNATGNGLSVDIASSGTSQFVLSATSNNGTTQGLYVRADGRVGIGTSAPAESLDIAGGIKFGNTSNANAGTLRWTGTDFEGYNGTEWVSLTAGGASNGLLSVNGFYAYDAAGEVSLNAGWTDMNLDTEVKEDSDFTHANDAAAVTINTAGWYEIIYNMSVYTVDGGNSQGSAQSRIMEDTGGGFVEVPGSTGYMFLRSGGSDSNAAVTVVRQFAAGDIIKLQAQRSSGTVNVTTRANSVGFTIKHITENAGGGGGSATAFEQNGNSFGANAILGTTDNYGLNIITGGSTALSFASTGEATFSNGVSVSNGGMSITGNSTISGTLSGLTGLTLNSGGADISGGINLNNSGITNTGNITGVGSDISALSGLTITSGGAGSITLDSASGLLVLNASTWRRAAPGTTTIELNDAANTTLLLANSDGSATANLEVEGLVSASTFSGNGSGITNLTASNLSGTIDDANLSSNVVLLDTSQTFTTINTFNSGLTLGNTASATSGTLRWTGSDFEGYNGTEWVSLTSGGGGGGSSAPLLQGVLSFGKVAANGTALNIDGATVTRDTTGTYTVTLDTATASADYTVQLTVAEGNATREDLHISIDNQTTTSFRVTIREGSSGGSTNVLVDKIWHFIAFDPDAAAGGGSTPSNAFTQNGNSFGTNAIFGTTDSYGLDVITGGSTVLAFAANGTATFSENVTFNDGVSISGNSTVNGTLSGLTGLTVVSGGANISGGINLNSSGIINAGSISGLTTLSLSGAISAATTTNTINGLIINAGTLSGVNGISQTGNYVMSGSGTFATGTGAVSLNGATTVSGSNSFTVSGGLTTLSAGASITGPVNINTSGSTATNIGTGTSSGVITIGSGNSPLVINSTNFDVSSGGALSGITTLTMSGAISAATTTNTINGLIISSGSVSGITGMTFTSGSLNLANGGIINAGSLAGVTTITASGNINTTGVYQQNGTSGLGTLNCTSGQFIGAASVRGGIVTAGACEADQKSDIRLKENIVQLSSVLDGVKQLNIVEYDYRCEEEQYVEMRLNCDRQTGVIAQELETVFPDLVYTAEDGYKRVRTNALNFYNLKAVSEIAKTIDSQQNVSSNTLATGGTIRLNNSGRLQNINGLQLVGGGASIVGGLNNNNGGISNAGDISGIRSLTARRIRINANSSDNLLELTKDNQGVFTVFNNGALELRSTANKAFIVKDSEGDDFFSVNTQGGLIRIGSEQNTTAVLLVLHNVSLDSDPAGVNGAQYYNSKINKFRCFENGVWKDCISKLNSEYTITTQPFSWVQPAEEAEIPSKHRSWVDLTSANSYRMTVQVDSPGVASAECGLQFTTDLSTDSWQNLDATAAYQSVATEGILKTQWLELSPSAKQEIQLRVICRGGDSNGSQQGTTLKISSVRFQVR